MAISVAIVRAFVQLREMLSGQRQLAGKLAELKQRLEGHDEATDNSTRRLLRVRREEFSNHAASESPRRGRRSITL
jgi:hypothetical protein